MGLSFDRELQSAIRTINALIAVVNRNGGGICLHYLDNPDFSIKLDRPVDIAYFIPVSRDEEGKGRREAEEPGLHKVHCVKTGVDTA